MNIFFFIVATGGWLVPVKIPVIPGGLSLHGKYHWIILEPPIRDAIYPGFGYRVAIVQIITDILSHFVRRKSSRPTRSSLCSRSFDQ
jgi:hypothetical protein